MCSTAFKIVSVMKQYNLRFLALGKYCQYNLSSKAGHYINEICIFPPFLLFPQFYIQAEGHCV